MFEYVCSEIRTHGLSLPNEAHEETTDLSSLRTSTNNVWVLKVALGNIILDPTWMREFNANFRFR